MKRVRDNTLDEPDHIHSPQIYMHILPSHSPLDVALRLLQYKLQTGRRHDEKDKNLKTAVEYNLDGARFTTRGGFLMLLCLWSQQWLRQGLRGLRSSWKKAARMDQGDHQSIPEEVRERFHTPGGRKFSQWMNLMWTLWMKRIGINFQIGCLMSCLRMCLRIIAFFRG